MPARSIDRSVRVHACTSARVWPRGSASQNRALFSQRLLLTRWWADVRAGKAAGRGSLVLRAAVRLGSAGVPAIVAVYENWGDLHFDALDRRSGHRLSLRQRLPALARALAPEPALLAAFLAAVRANSYGQRLLARLLERLDVLPHAFRGGDGEGDGEGEGEGDAEVAARAVMERFLEVG